MRRLNSATLAIVLNISLGTAFCLAWEQVSASALKIEDVANLIELQPHSALGEGSPDGELIAYSACDSHRLAGDMSQRKALTDHSAQYSLGCDIYVTSVRERLTRKLDTSVGGNWAPSWSPDSRSLAFFSDRDGTPHIWMWDRSRGTVRKVSDALVKQPSQSEPPLWLPDGRNVLVRLVPENDAAELPRRASSEKKWDSNVEGSTLVLYRSGLAAVQKSPQEQSPKNPMPKYFLGDIAVVDLGTGSARRLVIGADAVLVGLSPDGRRLAYVEFAGRAEVGRFMGKGDLMLTDVAGGSPSRLVAGIEQYLLGSITWSPDGKYLAYASAAEVKTDGASAQFAAITDQEEKLERMASGHLYIVAADGGTPRRMTGAPDRAFVTNSKPLWNSSSTRVLGIGSGRLWQADVAAGTVKEIAVDARVDKVVRGYDKRSYWSPDNDKSLYSLASHADTRSSGIVKIDLAANRTTTLMESVQQFGGVGPKSPVVTSDGRTVIYYTEGASESPNMWAADIDFKRPKQITSLNPQLDGYTFGKARLIDYLSADGVPLRGALLLPSDYRKGQRYPLLVWVYASDEGSKYLSQFGLVSHKAFNMHMFTTRGYAVLWPDIPVHVGTPLRDTMKSVMPAIDKVAEMGIADPQRLAVMGQSQGGWTVLSLLVQTTRFKAAIMNAGFGDLTAFYGLMDPVNGSGVWIPNLENLGTGMGVPPWEAPLRYVENSPVYYLDRVQTPIIVQAGSKDFTIVPFSDQVFVGLQRLGKEATYLRYEGEDHVLTAYPNIVDYWNRVIPFVEQHVAPLRQRQ